MNVVGEILSRCVANDATKKTTKIYATAQTEVQGKLIIEGKSFDERVSDYLNDSRSFIPILNAEIYLNSKVVAKHDFFCINKQFITYVIED